MSYEDSPDPRDFERREAADKSVYVKFYTKPVKNEEKSITEGRPIFDDKEYLEIRTPGDQNNVIQRPVTQMDRDRFRRAYGAFKDGLEAVTSGTPLAEVAWITRSQVEELTHMKVMSLEQLSELRDDICSRYAGMYALKQKAQAHLKAATEAAPAQEIQKLREEMEKTNADNMKVIAEQSAIIKSLREQMKAAPATN